MLKWSFYLVNLHNLHDRTFKRWYTIISFSEVCWVIVSGLFNIYWKKIAATVFELIWCIKTKFFQIFMDSMFLSTVYFFKVCSGCTCPCNISVINIGMYLWIIQWHKGMFMYFISSFQCRFSYCSTPKNFKYPDRSISLLFIFNFGKRSDEISSFLLGLWKKQYFVLVTFRRSLF